jgi:hypothetical protein
MLSCVVFAMTGVLMLSVGFPASFHWHPEASLGLIWNFVGVMTIGVVTLGVGLPAS